MLKNGTKEGFEKFKNGYSKGGVETLLNTELNVHICLETNAYQKLKTLEIDVQIKN